MSDHDDDEAGGLSILAETANYAVLLGEDMEGQPVYNVELGSVTLHLYQEEWDELIELVHGAE